jgi:tetratricopeptide (TPR) repeat protein
MKEFVLSDGVEALIEYLDHENLYERSQAMETVVSFIDCDFFDWFATPTTHQTQQMHLKMISILNSSVAENKSENYFLTKLIANRQHSYPGGSFRALQLLAFWLSWIRALYTKDQRLVLSSKLLHEIKHWTESSGQDGKENIEEEVNLAHTLYEDFGVKQFEDNPQNHDEKEQKGLMLSGVQTPDFPTRSSLSVNTDPSLLKDASSVGSASPLKSPTHPSFEVTPSLEVILKYKQEGNDLYKAEKFDLALKSYSKSLQLLQNLINSESKQPLSGEEETHFITLHSNIANTLWKLWESKEKVNDEGVALSEAQKEELAEYFYNQIQKHCQTVLELRPEHIKTSYRLFQTMMKRKEYCDVFVRINKLLSCFQKTGNKNMSNETMKNDLELLERLKRKCFATYLSDSNTTSIDPREWNLTEKDLMVLKSLFKRFQVSDAVFEKTFSKEHAEQETALINNTEKKKESKKKSSASEQIKDDESVLTNQDMEQEIKKKAPEVNNHKNIKSQLKVTQLKSSDRKLIQKLKSFSQGMVALYEKEPKDLLEQQKDELAQSGFEVSV